MSEEGNVLGTPEVVRTSADLAHTVQQFVENVRYIWKKLQESLEPLFIEWAWTELVERAGWLPHASIPSDLLCDVPDTEEADRRLAQHFRTHWEDMETRLRDSISGTVLDADAKESFEQALLAHRSGLYRVAPTLLFPQIERVARQVLLPAAHGADPAKELREAVGSLGFSQFSTPGIRGMRLFSKFYDHLYKQVRTIDEVEAARADTVPNRHAAIHGRVSYASEKSSLNMLIMADFVFNALSTVILENEAKLVAETSVDTR